MKNDPDVFSLIDGGVGVLFPLQPFFMIDRQTMYIELYVSFTRKCMLNSTSILPFFMLDRQTMYIELYVTFTRKCMLNYTPFAHVSLHQFSGFTCAFGSCT